MHPRNVRVRNYAAALACCVLGCGGRTEEDVVTLANNLPPWHMWGNGQTVVVNHAVAILITQTSQLARISYGRPESWRFFFAAKILDSSTDNAGVPDAGQLQVAWRLQIGLGRAQHTIDNFANFIFTWVAPTNPVGLQKYTSQVDTPLLSDIVATSAQTIDTIVAQDIQLSADLDFTGGAVPVKTLTVELDCFFSPISHVRPEWYRCDFRGNEDHGS